LPVGKNAGASLQLPWLAAYRGAQPRFPETLTPQPQRLTVGSRLKIFRASPRPTLPALRLAALLGLALSPFYDLILVC
jgi:hypothetical protein